MVVVRKGERGKEDKIIGAEKGREGEGRRGENEEEEGVPQKEKKAKKKSGEANVPGTGPIRPQQVERWDNVAGI